MTGEYIPAWIVGIADLLLVALVVCSDRLADTEQYRAFRPLMRYVIAVSFIIALLVFLCICLNAYRLTKCHVHDPHTAGEYSLGVGEKPPSGLHSLGIDRDLVADIVHERRPRSNSIPVR